jgi:hypothetical protein
MASVPGRGRGEGREGGARGMLERHLFPRTRLAGSEVKLLELSGDVGVGPDGRIKRRWERVGILNPVRPASGPWLLGTRQGRRLSTPFLLLPLEEIPPLLLQFFLLPPEPFLPLLLLAVLGLSLCLPPLLLLLALPGSLGQSQLGGRLGLVKTAH